MSSLITMVIKNVTKFFCDIHFFLELKLFEKSLYRDKVLYRFHTNPQSNLKSLTVETNVYI